MYELQIVPKSGIIIWAWDFAILAIPIRETVCRKGILGSWGFGRQRILGIIEANQKMKNNICLLFYLIIF